MALRAAQAAVKRAGQTPEELDLLLYASTWHQGPDGWLPHSYLQRHLVGGGVRAVEIRQGCNGLFMAFELAGAYLTAVPDRRAALIVAADNYGTPLLNRWSMGTGYVPGDAGSALVLSRQPGFAELRSVCSTTLAEGEELHRGGEPLFPPSITLGRALDFTERFRGYHAGPAKGASALARIPEEIVGIARQCVAEAGIAMDDVTKVAFINYSSREVIEQRCMAPLGLPMSRSTWDFGRTVGHCGASDHVLSLDHLVTTGALESGDHVLMLGIAPGVVLSGAVIKILRRPSWAG
jgi:3-oxoacyl-[acyl-carrier-protein] synthase-3/clorobiocin biosynthesis protein CloN2